MKRAIFPLQNENCFNQTTVPAACYWFWLHNGRRQGNEAKEPKNHEYVPHNQYRPHQPVVSGRERSRGRCAGCA